MPLEFKLCEPSEESVVLANDALRMNKDQWKTLSQSQQFTR